MIAENLAVVKERIKKAAQKTNRNPEAIRLICVTKNRSLEEVQEAAGCGITDIGENRVQEAKRKRQLIKGNYIKWHLIGHLQTNKARDAVEVFDLIHSVDSVRLAEAIDRQAAKINKVQEVLVEVKTSGEETKFGVAPEETIDLIKGIIGLHNIRLSGLMTMAPIVADSERARPYFKVLRELKDEINKFLTTECGAKRSEASPEGKAKPPRRGQLITDLSMGMSQDYEAAIEEGATMIRIGTAIFEG